jgi:hypothetical protein
MTFDFGGVLTRAWQITWKYKILWIFGIFAGCSRNSGPGFNWNTNRNELPQNWTYNPGQAEQWVSQNWWVIALIILAIILLVLLAILLGTIGRIGLIRGTLQAEEGAQSLSFNNLFSGSTPFFWRVFGLTFLIGVIFLLIMLPFILFGVITAGLGFLCLLPLICVLMIVGMAVNLVVELANVAIVRENLGIVDGWRRGWEMARLNPGPVILMAIILFVITFVVGLLIVIPVIAVAVPAAIAIALGANGSNNYVMPLLLAGLCFVAFLPVGIFINGVVNTFVGSAWTLTYLRLVPPAAAPTPPAEPPALTEANA